MIRVRIRIAAYVWGFVQWPIRDPGSRAAKRRSWVKYRFLDHISKRPCQPELLLGFIQSLSIYSDGHCTKPNVGRSRSNQQGFVLRPITSTTSHSATFLEPSMKNPLSPLMTNS
jgi:hypothetical protein